MGTWDGDVDLGFGALSGQAAGVKQGHGAPAGPLSQLSAHPSLPLPLSSCVPKPAAMVFRRFVEIGRVALINYGPEHGKLVVIVDVVDQNRALIDAPDMVRTQINFKRLSLTDITIPELPRTPSKKVLKKAYDDADVEGKWSNSAWGKKLAVRIKRASLNDFDRFKVMVARVKRSSIVRRELGKLRREKA